MNKKYAVRLTSVERAELEALAATGEAPATTRARILLSADCGPSGPAATDEAISAALGVSISTIVRVRRACALHGASAALHRRPAPRRPRKLEDRHAMRLAALARTAPPEGKKRWTVRSLTARLAEQADLGAISRETVRKILKQGAHTGAARAGG